jgi:pimeloyl-ACP methyl ester carboxylesterase
MAADPEPGPRRLALACGVHLHYQVQGPPGAPWLVLLNGMLSDTTLWAGTLKAFAADHRVLSFDSRGQGRSSAPLEGPYTLPLLAAEAWELMERLGIQRPWLVGLSMGSSLGLELMAAHPGAISGAVLTSAVARTDFAMAVRLRHWLHCLEVGGPGMQFDAAAPDLWGDRFLEPRYAVLRDYFLKRGTLNEPLHASRHQIEGVLQWDFRSSLGAIRDRVLLLAGAEDLLTPPWKCLETAQGIPQARFEIVPGVGHAFPVESPGPFCERVSAFIRE